eukprot:scaffold1052_cov198-Alexandrium_tamarense.AAC.22
MNSYYLTKIKLRPLPHLFLTFRPPPQPVHNHSTTTMSSFISELLKPGGGIALIPFIRMTIATLLLMVV